MNGETQLVWLIAFAIFAGILFGGNPDLIDVLIHFLMSPEATSEP